MPKILPRAADERHHVGNHRESAAFDGSCRALLLGEARPPEHPVADEIGQALQHVDADDAGAADAIAADAIEARGVERSKIAEVRPWPGGWGRAGVRACRLLQVQRPEQQAEFGRGGLQEGRDIRC